MDKKEALNTAKQEIAKIETEQNKAKEERKRVSALDKNQRKAKAKARKAHKAKRKQQRYMKRMAGK